MCARLESVLRTGTFSRFQRLEQEYLVDQEAKSLKECFGTPETWKSFRLVSSTAAYLVVRTVL